MDAIRTPLGLKTPARYAWRLLRAGPLRLDGGSMFGVVPRVIWSKANPPDEQGRILVAHNCLLLERHCDPANLNENSGIGAGPRRVLVETGSGNKFDAKNRAIYGLTDYSVGDAVEEAGVRSEDVDHVIVTHLHFDHAGGLTRRLRPGESPDWTPPNPDPMTAGVRLTFPNAPITVQRLEWEDGLINRSVMTRTYLRENLEPIRERLRLIDSPPPFPAGHLPGRDELPMSLVSDRQVEVLPGIFVFRVPGHTWGQQAVRFTDDEGRAVVFTPDVLPTVNHLGAAYNLAYDVESYISTVTRRWFLEEASRGQWLLVLDHEPGNPCCRVRPDGKGWYEFLPEES